MFGIFRGGFVFILFRILGWDRFIIIESLVLFLILKAVLKAIFVLFVVYIIKRTYTTTLYRIVEVHESVSSFFSLPLSAFFCLLGHSVANDLMFLALIRNFRCKSIKYMISWSIMEIIRQISLKVARKS